MDIVEVKVIPYHAPKKADRTWQSKGYVWSQTRAKVNAKDNNYYQEKKGQND